MEVDITEFKVSPVEVKELRMITSQFRGLCEIRLKLIRKNRKITTCDWLDLETLTRVLTVGANRPVHWFLGGKGLGIQQGTSAWVDFDQLRQRHLIMITT